MGISSRNSGFTLVELILATVILLIVGAAVVKGLQMISVLSVRSRQEMRSQRIFRDFKTQLDALPFELVFPVDSKLPNWGLGPNHPNYGGNATMQALKKICEDEGFPRFKIEVTFMRRDTSNVGGNGTSALISFTDMNNDGIDDYDPNIRYQDMWSVPSGTWTFTDVVAPADVDDVNGTSLSAINRADGDFFDSCVYNGTTFTDMPNTNLRKVKISLFSAANSNVEFSSQEYLISKEKLSGNTGTSAESDLKIDITSPAQPRDLWDSGVTGHNLSLNTPYPSPAYRADNSHALRVQGVTAPNAKVYVSTITPPSSAPAGLRDDLDADFSGNFNITAQNTTNGLVEGLNSIYYESSKTVNIIGISVQMRSPIGRFRTVLDLQRPDITTWTPTGNNVRTLSPYVGATLKDVGVATTTVSGICGDVLTIMVTPQGQLQTIYTPPHVFYDPQTNQARWWNPSNHLPVTLSNLTRYDVDMEGGDFAHYGRRKSWHFIVNIQANDTTPPAISSRNPPNLALNVTGPVTVRCTIGDPDSGVDFSTVRLDMDGAPVINSSITPLLGDYIDVQSGVLTVPPMGCPSGHTYTVRIRAQHWGTTGIATQDWVDDTWTFTCQ